MKLPVSLAAALLISTSAVAGPSWTVDQGGMTAVFSSPELEAPPLRLSCAKGGFLVIDVLSGPTDAITLTAPERYAVTIRGEARAGRILSNVHFRSMTLEFLREEDELQVSGKQSYRVRLEGLRDVLRTIESACLASS